MKKITKYQVVESDRVSLIYHANFLVQTISARRESVGGHQIDGDEMSAYRSALRYLNEQFEKGARDAETVLVETEIETKEIDENSQDLPTAVESADD